MTRSTFNLLIIVTVALYIIGRLIYLTRGNKPILEKMTAVDNNCFNVSDINLVGKPQPAPIQFRPSDIKSWAYYM